MKDIELKIELKQGLPNYSSRTVTVTRIADQGESLDITTSIPDLTLMIREAWDYVDNPSAQMIAGRKLAIPPEKGAEKEDVKTSEPISQPATSKEDVLAMIMSD